MKLDPIDIALRHVSETRSILELLITSSESFDYPKAKQALTVLSEKMRELGKIKAQLESDSRPVEANIRHVDFSGVTSPAGFRPPLS